MTLEADQAVQEARFAGACQDQHAGRPAPSLGWPGNQSCNKPLKGNQLRDLGQGFPGVWGPGLGAGASRALGGPWGPRSQTLSAHTTNNEKVSCDRQAKGWETAETEWGPGGKRARDTPPTPPPGPPRI